jgi:hypothetical protein
MSRRREHDESELNALRTLRKTVLEGRGWMRGGVRGWLLGAELNDLSGSSVASLSLQRLRGLGLVLGESVRDPGRKQPPVVWRLTQVGEMELARLEEREPEIIPLPVPDPEDERVIYIGANAWRCLAVLKKQHPRWVRWRDAVAEVRRRHGSWVYLSDTLTLMSRGLAEREDEGEGSGKVIWFRATTAAHATRLLDDRASTDWVQIRLPAPRRR